MNLKTLATVCSLASLILISGSTNSNGQSDRNIKSLIKAAEQGDAESQFKLAEAYLVGSGINRDYVEALKWFWKAAEQGDAEAQFHLGLLYGYGEGVLRDNVESAKWLCRAAEQTGASAQFFLGLRYLQGNGVSQNYEEAVKWFRKAAEKSLAKAQLQLGTMYLQGNGVSQNYEEAVKWIRAAAEQGEVSAQCILGTLYDTGKGVSQDYVQAYVFLNLCADAAKGTEQKTAAKFRDQIAKQMSPQQMEEVKKLAREWEPVRMPSAALMARAKRKTPSSISGKDKGPYFVGANEVKPPQVLYKSLPFYTDKARKKRTEGIILIQAIIHKDGSVDNFRVLRGLGNDLDESALYAIASKWRFQPGTRNGVPVDVLANIEVTFRLY
jgi:TonB family protein